MPPHDALVAIARSHLPAFRDAAPYWDRERRYCHENVDRLARSGLMGMTIPLALGGRGASLATAARIVEEVATACTLTARVVVEANMGALTAVMTYGTDEQKWFCAPIVLAGDKPAILITEPDAGSDATAMRTTATPVNGGWRLDGEKHWITGGGVSKLHLVFAQMLDEGGDRSGIGGFIVHRDPERGIEPEGFAVKGLERTLGLCGMPEARIAIDGVFVPDAMRLRTPGPPGKGFAKLMAAYNAQRIGAGAAALGTAVGALDRAKDYLKERHQFGRPIAEFQGLQWMVADMDTRLHAARLMLQEAARSADPLPDPVMTARAKLFATETAVTAVNDCLQLMGARGYGAQEPIERMLRDVRMFTIGGGTAQVLRNQIAAHALGLKLPQTRGAAPAMSA